MRRVIDYARCVAGAAWRSHRSREVRFVVDELRPRRDRRKLSLSRRARFESNAAKGGGAFLFRAYVSVSRLRSVCKSGVDPLLTGAQAESRGGCCLGKAVRAGNSL